MRPFAGIAMPHGGRLNIEMPHIGANYGCCGETTGANQLARMAEEEVYASSAAELAIRRRGGGPLGCLCGLQSNPKSVSALLSRSASRRGARTVRINALSIATMPISNHSVSNSYLIRNRAGDLAISNYWPGRRSRRRSLAAVLPAHCVTETFSPTSA